MTSEFSLETQNITAENIPLSTRSSNDRHLLQIDLIFLFRNKIDQQSKTEFIITIKQQFNFIRDLSFAPSIYDRYEF